MDYPDEFPTILRPASFAIPADALLTSGLTEEELEIGSALPFASYGQSSTSPTYAASRFHGPHSQLQGPFSLMAEREAAVSIPHPQAFPPTVIRPAWNDISSNIAYAPFPLPPSEEPTYHIQQPTAMVANNRPIYTPPHPEHEKTRSIFSATSSHPAHVMEWYRIRAEAVIHYGPREFIPQTIYEPRYEGDKRRYVSHANIHPPVLFLAEHSPEWGIPVLDLLSGGLTSVADGHKPAFTPCRLSICIRIHWPGYRPWRKKLLTKDHTSKRGMITKEKLAKLVARYIKEFIEAMSTNEIQAGSYSQWTIGSFGIRVDDIVLVSLHQVSQGSWQPQLRVRRDIETNTSAEQHIQGRGEAGEV